MACGQKLEIVGPKSSARALQKTRAWPLQVPTTPLLAGSVRKVPDPLIPMLP